MTVCLCFGARRREKRIVSGLRVERAVIEGCGIYCAAIKCTVALTKRLHLVRNYTTQIGYFFDFKSKIRRADSARKVKYAAKAKRKK